MGSSLVPLKNRLIKFLNLMFRLFGTPAMGQVEAMRTPVYPAREITLEPPLFLEDTLHWKFRKLLKVYFPATFVTILPQARVWGNQGAVITRDNIFFEEVSREFEGTGADHSIFKQWKIEPVTPLSGSIAVIATSGNEVYYHWMFDILPRVALLRKSGLYNKADRFILNYRRLPFQLETMSRLGFPDDRVIASTNHWHFHVQAQELIVPSLVSPNDCPSEETCFFIRQLFADCMCRTTPSRKIYIQRTRGRKLENEAAVVSLVQAAGFEVARPEELTVAQQATLFSEACWVVAPHGAGLTNLVFCQKGTFVIDIFSPEWVNPCYWILSHHLGLRYAYLLGEGPSVPEGIDPQNKAADINIDPRKLAIMLKRLQESAAGQE